MQYGGSTKQFHYDRQQLENVDTFLGHVLTNNHNIHKSMTEYLATQSQKALFALQGHTSQTLGIHHSATLSQDV